MCFSPLLPGIFNSFSADGDQVTDRLPDGLTDRSVDVWTEGSFPGYCVEMELLYRSTQRYFHHEFS